VRIEQVWWLGAFIVAAAGFLWALRERRKRQRQELRQRESEAASLDRERELGELKSNFVSMVSHEFRTPLAVILSSTELLRNHLDRLSPERRAQQLMSIHSSTLQMARLIEEVLLLDRVEAGRMTCDAQPLDLREICGALSARSGSETSPSSTHSDKP
jgi:signal transduction histidine kinase